VGWSCRDGVYDTVPNNFFDLVPSSFDSVHLTMESLSRNGAARSETLQRGFPIPVKPPDGYSPLLQLADQRNTGERKAPVNYRASSPRLGYLAPKVVRRNPGDQTPFAARAICYRSSFRCPGHRTPGQSFYLSAQKWSWNSCTGALKDIIERPAELSQARVR
jgi:hypothetical protein